MNSPDGIAIDGTLDGQIDLLDRQIVSADGLMIAKVDDIELEERADGTLIVSAFLAGPGALGRRLGGSLEYIVVNTWTRLSGRDEPRRIDYSHVKGIDTVIAVDERRRTIWPDDLEAWVRTRLIDALPGAQSGVDVGTFTDGDDSVLDHGPGRQGDRHRFSELAGMSIRFSDGTDGDQVIDVRMEQTAERGHLPRLVTSGLIVGRNRPGTLFGYDRDSQKGPWLIKAILRWAHRHSGYVPWTDVAAINWDERRVRLRTNELAPIPEP
ncbi:MAG: hypothetical protein JWQ70_2135 [Aeromicrobium sp.]|nr:hypothetical protein [Aeromicrobium sp.]